MKKIFLVMSLFVFLTTFVNAEEKSDVIATVNGKTITKTFVNKILQLCPKNKKQKKMLQYLPIK